VALRGLSSEVLRRLTDALQAAVASPEFIDKLRSNYVNATHSARSFFPGIGGEAKFWGRCPNGSSCATQRSSDAGG
jgi:hypothetical protein